MTGFGPEDVTHDGFLGGAVTVIQPKTGYRAATDPVWLAAACPAKSGQSVLELGCGAGTALACLTHRVAGLSATGLELQPAYAALATRNLAGRAEVIEGDLAQMPESLRTRSFDHVIFNPPYFSAQSVPAQDEGRDTAHREDTPLALWIDMALRRLKPKGTITLIHRTERLTDILAGLQGRAGSVRLRPLAAREGRVADRVLVHAVKTGRAPLRLLPPIIVHAGAAHDADAPDFTDVAEGVLRRGAAILWEV